MRPEKIALSKAPCICEDKFLIETDIWESIVTRKLGSMTDAIPPISARTSIISSKENPFCFSLPLQHLLHNYQAVFHSGNR